ncbi:MAG: glycosyltransferase family 4 protein [bacterium]
MDGIIFIFAFISLSIAGAFLTQAIRSYTIRRSIFDIPNDRSSHTLPTPRGGGLAIVIITVSSLVAVQAIHPLCTWPCLVTYLTGSVLTAVIGWLDDVHPLPASLRFCVQAVSASFIISGFGFFKTMVFPILGQVSFGLIGLPLTFLWIVGLSNSYNFMDGIDGIAGCQAVMAGLGWAFGGWYLGLPLITILGTLLAASSAGFLWHNWPPASIFMGDVGSVFLGYSFASLAVIGSQKNPSLGLVGILLVWPFIFDTSLTFFRRLKNGENIFAAHRTHIYQRLVISGHDHRIVTLLYGGLDVLGIIFSLLIMRKKQWADIMLIFLLPLMCLSLWGYTAKREKIHPATLRAMIPR